MAKFKFLNNAFVNLARRFAILLFMFTISPTISFAQKQGDVWCFGERCMIDFSDINNPIIGQSAMNSRGSCSSVSTPNGELLFYAGTIAQLAPSLPEEYLYAFGRFGIAYNRYHEVMPNGYALIGEAWVHEYTILPDGNNPHKYYIITLSVSAGGGGSDTIVPGIYYSIVDMDADSGRGDVVLKNQLIYTDSSEFINELQMTDKLVAFQHGNGRDWWIFNNQLTGGSLSDSAYFVKHLLTPEGFILAEKSRIMFTPDTTGGGGAFGEIILNPDGNRIMVTTRFGALIEYQINRCTGSFELARVLYVSLYDEGLDDPLNETFFGQFGEYSPSGKLFYLNFIRDSNEEPRYTCQINLEDLDPWATRVVLYDNYEVTDFDLEQYDFDYNGELKLAPDGKIYQATWSASAYYNYPYPDTAYFNEVSQNLSVINSPDSLGAACDFQLYSFPLGGNRTYLGLPNNPNYRLGPLDGSPCDTLGINALQEIKPSNRPKAFTYPNPAKETLWLSIGEKAFKAGTSPPKASLYDINGKKVFETKVQQLPVQLYINKLPSGVYSGRLTFSGAEYYFKVVKE